MNPGKIVDAPADDRSPARRGPAAAAAAGDAAPLRRPGRHARRRGPVHEHRAVPQDGDRGHVPVVHGHPRRGALHPGPRERPGATRCPCPTRARRSATSRLHGILDLCLECKACKSECPLGVDMAALKTEALAAYHDRHGVPLRSRMFGSIRGAEPARLGRVPAVQPGRRVAARPPGGERWLGVSAARPLPRFQRHDLRSWRRRPRPGRRQRPRASWSSSPTPSPPSPSRRPGGRPSSCWSSPGGGSGSRTRGAAAGPACPRG